MTEQLLPVAISAAFLLSVAAPASAGPNLRSEEFIFYEEGPTNANVPTGQPTSSLVGISGVVNAVGTDQYAPSKPGDPSNVDRDVFTFPHGTLFSKVTKQTDVMPLDACTVAIKLTGKFQITGGTGVYKRARGVGTFSQHGIGVNTAHPGAACGPTGAYYVVGTGSTSFTLVGR